MRIAPMITTIVFFAGFAIATAFAENAEPIAVDARPVPLSERDPELTRVGRLEYRGGLELSSRDPRFGGLSGLLVDADGKRFVALSDRGYWFRGTIAYDGKGDLKGVADVSIAAMRGLDGEVLVEDTRRDAETLAPLAAGDGVLIGFEREHRLWVYRSDDRLPMPMPMPEGADAAPFNGGFEAATLLGDGRYLVLSENLEADGGVGGWIGGENGWKRLTWAVSERFRPTGAATLPDGDVLILERRALPPGARLSYVDGDAIVPGATLSGEELARLEGAFTVDNMEGIDARGGVDGKILVYLLSDDNYDPIQRTLLLMFELAK